MEVEEEGEEEEVGKRRRMKNWKTRKKLVAYNIIAIVYW